MTPASQVHDPDLETTRRQWIQIAVLWTATFTVVTSQTLLVGLLTPMADGLGVDAGTIGYALTITSIVTALVAPLVPRILGSLDRKHAIAVALVLLGLGNIVTATAQNFAVLAVGRVVLGVAVAVVWSLAGVVASRLVAPRHGPLAISIAVSGVASAAVLGVPLGTIFGDLFGWRSSFGFVGVVALILVGVVMVVLPRLPGSGAVSPHSANSRSSLHRARPKIVVGLVVIAFLVTAHFVAYTYIRAILERGAGFGPTEIAVALLAYGAVGLVGNFVGGALAARRARPTITAIAVGILLAVSLLAAGSSVFIIVAMSILLWGLAYGGLSVSGQIWLTRSDPGRAEQITGQYVGIFNASVALGSFVGGAVLDSVGTTTLLCFAAALTFIALVILPWSPAPSSDHVSRDRDN